MYKDAFTNRTGQLKKFIQYLACLEMDGYLDGYIFAVLGDYHRRSGRIIVDLPLGTDYLQRAVDFGYAPACLVLSGVLQSKSRYYADDHSFNAIRFLVKAEEKGLGEKDERILGTLIGYLEKYLSSGRVLGRFTSNREMAEYYCNVLTQRGCPQGYYWNGRICISGRGHIKGLTKAVSYWEESDRAGLADYPIYYQLQLAYRYVHYVMCLLLWHILCISTSSCLIAAIRVCPFVWV